MRRGKLGCAHRITRSPSSRRSGTTLVLAAILMFVFFAFAGMVIDIAIARVTRVRMVSASDAAALEALRWRDQFPDTVTDPDGYVIARGGDPANADDVAAARDHARRDQAAKLVNTICAASTGDPRFGAGPLFDSTPGSVALPEVNAFETLLPAAMTVYKPQLALNDAMNLDNGDEVAGAYNTNVAASHAEGKNADFFARDDFAVSAPTDAPQAPSMLVRMRHSRDQAVDSVASTGPTIPFIFARGSLLAGHANSIGYAPRRDGMTVRATSIATAQPAVYAGPPIDASAVQGICRIALYRDFWENTLAPVAADGTTTSYTVDVNSSTITFGGAAVGMPLGADASTIGTIVSPAAAELPATFKGYVCIIEEIPAGTPRVIGFGWIELDVSGGSATLTKLCQAGGAIAPRNASADLRLAWPTLAPPTINDSDRAAVRTANATLKDPLLCPVLVRSTGD